MNGSSDPTVIVLEPGRRDKHYWRDLWHFRELLAIFAWRDITVRYKQTVVGVLWAGLRPLLTMVVFTIVFGEVADLPADGGAPYPVMVFAAMLPWFLMSGIIAGGSGSVVGNASLITRVYFPRVIFPFASAVLPLVDSMISIVLLAILMVWFGHAPSWQILLLPLFFVLAVAVALGPAFFFSALNAKYRDFTFIVPFALQLALYISPVGFSSNVIPDQWRFLYSLNPLVGVVDGFRWSVLGGDTGLYVPGLIVSVVFAGACLWAGLKYFRRAERAFADLL
jgi:lipopolysaccharide transport system permease protein